MEKVIVKTLLAVQPYVAHTYKSCIPENRYGRTDGLTDGPTDA